MKSPSPAAPRLPDCMTVIERDWLSSNSVLFVTGEEAALIDSGYVSAAAETVARVEQALAGKKLRRLFNTHAHSDHIGGNAALQAAFGCSICVPAGAAASIAEWDEEALLLAPLGQQAARFTHDATYAAGDTLQLGELAWQALAAPGHDMDALILYNPEKRLLISGDALWRDGFGVVFPELLGNPNGLSAARQSLELIARLDAAAVIPGHGAPFVDVAEALERAFSRLDAFENSIERLARHALKVIVTFFMLEKQRIAEPELRQRLLGLGFVRSINARYLGLDPEELNAWLLGDLLRAGALRAEDGYILPAGR